MWRRWRWWRWWRRWRQSSSAGSWRNESLGIGRRRRRRRIRRKRRRQLPPIESGFARRTGEENSGGETASEVSTKRGRTFELGLSLSLSPSLSLSLSLSSKHRLGVRTSPIRSAGSLTIFVRDKTRYPSVSISIDSERVDERLVRRLPISGSILRRSARRQLVRSWSRSRLVIH